MIKKRMPKDVLYFMVDNLPSQEETRESVAQLEHMIEQARYGSLVFQWKRAIYPWSPGSVGCMHKYITDENKQAK
jgi:hypothetical protein